MPRVASDRGDAPPLGRELVLDELGELATVEHALCVEYLLIHAALGHDLGPADGSDAARRVSDAASAAGSVAQDQMRYLHPANQALVAAGRAPRVERAANRHRGSLPAIPLVPPSPAQLDRFLDRLQTIATTGDERYAVLCAAVTSPAAGFDTEVLTRLRAVLDPGPDHVAAAVALAGQLQGIPISAHLRATRHAPADAMEGRLLDVSDRYYSLTVATVETWFAHEETLGGVLRGRGIDSMNGLNEINGLLVAQGLLPVFTQVEGPAGP